MPVTATIQTRIAEDIALLHALAENPSEVVRPVPRKQNMTEGYSLSLDIEREFASDMAFLSSIRDDPTKITAIAVHETEDGQLRVLVAANANQDKSSQTYLDEVKRGFDSITTAMSMADTPFEVQLETRLLDLVIRMCKTKVLQRVWRQDATSLPSHIDEAIKILQAKKQNKTQKMFISEASILLGNLRSFGITSEKATKNMNVSNEDLKTLIRCCGNWEKQLDLKSFLRHDLQANLPKYDPSKARSLCDTIRKIGRYQTCANRLAQLASNNALFLNIKAICVSLDQEALQHTVLPEETPADQVLVRVSNGKFKEAQLSRLLQSATSNVAKSHWKFKASLRMAQGVDAKVHAEVQLLWYIKSLSLGKPPRVIESSKLACYLCSALIACTGEYEPGRSHGRIYRGWRLPSTAREGLHKRFAKYLETYIVDSLKERIESGVIRKGAIADCESSATVHRVPLETVLSPLLEADEKQQQDDVEMEVSEMQTPMGTEETTGHPLELPPDGDTHGIVRSKLQNGLEIRASEKVHDTAPVNAEEQGIHDDVEQDMAASATCDTRGRSQGPVDSVGWIRLPRGHIVCTHPCETLQVLIEHDNQRSAGSSELRVRVRQVCSGEVERSFRRQDVYIINELLDFGKEVTCGKGGDPILLRLGNKVLVVEVAGVGH